MPIVSVIMPVFNTDPEYLKASVTSVENQTFTDWELLIVDNASTNRPTLEYLKSLNTHKIKVFFLDENIGPSGGRNFAIDHSQGKYLACLDSDDQWRPEKLKIQVDMMEDDPALGCCSTLMKIINDVQDTSTNIPEIDETTWDVPTSEEIELEMMLEGNPIGTSSVMLRKEVLDKNALRFVSEIWTAEDYLLWTQLISKCRFHIIPQKLTIYRWHDHGISHKKAQQMLDNAKKTRSDAAKAFFGENVYDDRLWQIFMKGRPADAREAQKVLFCTEKIIRLLQDRGYLTTRYYDKCRHQFRGLFLRTKNIKGQLALWRSPLSSFFRIPITWKLFCLITRGIL